MTRRSLIAVAIVALLAAGVAVAASSKRTGRIGPRSGIQPSGRLLKPAGRLTTLGNFPAGGALTTDGRFLWTLSAGRGRNDVRIVSLPKGRLVQTVPMPGLSGGIAMAPDGKTAYVSGVPDSSHLDQRVPAGTPGRAGDVIHVLTYGASGKASRAGTIAVPPPAFAPDVQDFPPVTGIKRSWPRDLAASPDGGTLLAALNLANAAAIVDTRTRAVRYVRVGSYPYGAAITPDGKRGLVSNEADGTVSAIDLASGAKVKDITVGPHLSHPEGIAVDPKRPLAYVAVANQDLVAVLNTATLRVERTLSVGRSQGMGTSPTQVSVTADGRRLIVTDSGEDALAVFSLSGGRSARARAGVAPERLLGRVPVASYPTAAAATPDGKTLAWISGKGLGAGPNPRGPNPNSPNDSDDGINSFQYLPSRVFGKAGILRFPSSRGLRRLTPRASRQLLPTNRRRPPRGSPIGPRSKKIEHVFYIVRENRTYDQIMGDDRRGDGDPKLTLFGRRVTPNMHALARRFPLLDHVYANSEASIDGHFWTSAGAVSDYVVKSWPQNYAGRKRPYDFGVYAVSWPSKRFLFDQAEKQRIPYFNYGEAIAGTVPLFPDRDRTPAEKAAEDRKFANSDLGLDCFPADVSSGGVDQVLKPGTEIYDSSLPPGAPADAQSRFDCFRKHFRQQLAQGKVPAFNYITYTNDHTAGTTPGRRTPRAMIAENDWALGQTVDLISRSSVWKRSLILVVEDDSQDGADHVDAHRMPALAISPYARRGAVVHTRYDHLSFIRTLENTIGMKPLTLFDATAVPLYDAFGRRPSNAAPYTAILPKLNLTERNTASTPAARLSSRLPLNTPDRVPQRTLDRILWKYVHGARSTPPPPGPNAAGEDAGD